MKKIVLFPLLFGVCFAAAMGTIGCANKVVQPSAVPQVQGAGSDNSGTMIYTGVVIPQSEIQIMSKVSGTIASVNADIGSQVRAGAALCKVDDTDIKLQVEQAQAQYNAALTALDNMKNGITVQSATQLSQAVDKAKLDLSTAQTNYNQAKSNYDAHTQVNQARLTLNNATTAYNNAKGMLDSNTTVTQAQNAYNDAEEAYNSAKQLYDAGGIAKNQFDAAQSALSTTQAILTMAQTNTQQSVDTARNQMDSAQQAYDSAVLNEKNGLDAAQSALDNANLGLKTAQNNYSLTSRVLNPGNIKSAQASVDLAKATLDVAKRQLDDTVIAAPISGSISAKTVQKGMLITPAVPLFTLVDSSVVNIMIHVNQDDINSMQAGKDVVISIQNTDIKDHPGKIFAVSSSADLQTGMFAVKIAMDNSDGALKGGMFADITIKK
ncbi:MAG: efflux RND transporter periplasmic adaptor subunit [Treponema sp.]|nr:efflux RND transporter periplasmic adaptor subunit [Treponema sp.]